jgi:hypothetical protein
MKLTDNELLEMSRLHPPNCDCVHELCGEVTRELLDACQQLRSVNLTIAALMARAERIEAALNSICRCKNG